MVPDTLIWLDLREDLTVRALCREALAGAEGSLPAVHALSICLLQMEGAQICKDVVL